MAGRVYDLLVRARGETSDAEGAMRDLQASVTSAGKKMTNVGNDLTKYVTLPVLAAAGASVKLASDAGETANKLETLLGDGTERVTKKLDAFAKATGSSRYTLREQAATISALLTPMKLGAKATEDMTVNVVQLSKDLSSFHNIAEDDALDKLRAGLTGEAEPLKALGILINETAVKNEAYTAGIAKRGATLTEQQKVQARYNLILEQSSKAQGDATKTVDSFSNQMKAAQNSVKDIGVSLGQELLPIATQTLGVVRQGVDWFAGLDQSMQGVVVTSGLVAAALGPTLIVVGQVAQGAAVVAPAFVKVGKAMQGAAVAAGISSAAMAPLVVAAAAVAVAGATLIIREQEKADAFRKTSEAAREQIREFGSVADAQNRLAGAALSVKEANFAVTQAETSLAAARKAGDPTAITQATLALERAKLSQADATRNNKKVQDEENASIGQASMVANVALQKLNDEVAVRRRLAEVRAQIASGGSLKQASAWQKEAGELSSHLGRLERAHGSSLEAVKEAYAAGLISRKQIIAAGLADEVGIVVKKAPAMRAAGKQVGDAAAAGARASKGAARQAGAELAEGMRGGILDGAQGIAAAAAKAVRDAVVAGRREAEAASPSRRTAREIGRPFGQGIAVGIRAEIRNIENSASAAVRAGTSAGKRALGGFQGSGFSTLGDIGNSTMLSGGQALSGALKFAETSSSDAFTVNTDANGLLSVSENGDVTAFLRQRKATNEARLKTLNAQRNSLVSKLATARKALTAANTNLGKVRKSGTKKQIASAQENAATKRDAVGALEGQIEGIEQEIVQLGGAITQDASALEAPDVSAQNSATQTAIDTAATDKATEDARVAENFERFARGLPSLEQEAELNAVNQIRAKYGLAPVSNVSEIGNPVSPATTPETDSALTQGSIPQYLLPSSQSAAGAVRDAAMRAMTAGTTVNVYPQSGDVEAIGNRVAMILGSSRLRNGGTI